MARKFDISVCPAIEHLFNFLNISIQRMERPNPTNEEWRYDLPWCSRCERQEPYVQNVRFHFGPYGYNLYLCDTCASLFAWANPDANSSQSVGDIRKKPDPTVVEQAGPVVVQPDPTTVVVQPGPAVVEQPDLDEPAPGVSLAEPLFPMPTREVPVQPVVDPPLAGPQPALEPASASASEDESDQPAPILQMD